MQTIGERLEEARKKKGISIREAAEATKIRGDYLQKFEGNHFDIGLTEIYTRGFLRNYAGYLKLPADRILNDYSALGRGEARPRQPSREVYGRMDITVASAGEPSDRAAPPEEGAAEIQPARAQARYPRGSSSLPTGPDPAVIFRYVKWAAIGVVGLLALWLIVSLVGNRGGKSAGDAALPSVATQTATAPAAPRTFALVALDVVYVRVTSDKEGLNELFKGNLSRDQRQIIPRAGELYIWASAGENVKIEINGTLFPLPFTGNNRGLLPAP
jgi:cytoskeleton protein RodZ